MNILVKKWLSFGIALCMCVTPLAAGAAESLLNSRIDRAYNVAGRQIEAEIGIQLGEGMPALIGEETAAALQKLLRETKIIARAAKNAEGFPAIGFELSMQRMSIVTGTASLMADRTEVTTSLLPGKTLVLPPLQDIIGGAQGQLEAVLPDEQTAAALVSALERYLGIASDWTQRNRDMLPDGGSVTVGRLENEQLRLAISGAHLKDLLVRLAEAFGADAGLQAALEGYLRKAGGYDGSLSDLGAQLAEAAKGLQPSGGALNADMLFEKSGALISVTIDMKPMFEGMDQSLYARYEKSEFEDGDSVDFAGKLGWADGGQAALLLNHTVTREGSNHEWTDVTLSAMAQPSAGEPIQEFTLKSAYENDADDSKATREGTLTLGFAQNTASGEPASAPVELAFDTKDQTVALPGDDFTSDSSARIRLMGSIVLGTVTLHMSSGAYVPEDTSGNAVVDLRTITDVQAAALTADLQTGIGQALMSALSVMPEEITAMFGMN